jgi:hypothetical protein
LVDFSILSQPSILARINQKIEGNLYLNTMTSVGDAQLSGNDSLGESPVGQVQQALDYWSRLEPELKNC